MSSQYLLPKYEVTKRLYSQNREFLWRRKTLETEMAKTVENVELIKKEWCMAGCSFGENVL